MTGYSEGVPTPSSSRPECYNADGWDFYASNGILIRGGHTGSILRGVRYPLPKEDFSVQVRVSITELSETTEDGVVDLMIGLGAYPAARDNDVYNEWFYHIRAYGGDTLRQCVLFYYWDSCTSKDRIDSLLNLPLPSRANPLEVQMDIAVTNRQVEAIVYFIDMEGNPTTHEIQGLDPLFMDRPWWLWVGYSTMYGGSIRGLIELYSPIFSTGP